VLVDCFEQIEVRLLCIHEQNRLIERQCKGRNRVTAQFIGVHLNMQIVIAECRFS